MGFESSQVARRRLAVLAASNSRVQEALAPSGFPGFGPSEEKAPASRAERSAAGSLATAPGMGAGSAALVRQLEELARDIVATPGAGGALLAAYAAQARALTMVIEAARRASAEPLPDAVVQAVQDALSAPSPMPGLLAG
ncbi:MAG TPA: hypothetical protein VGE27_08895 [Gemmatimonas sp.]|uniref:hypothetical protein n=1 Tax=Gemmatimonas sp. TaxID=1962908 RepID=UPI002EDAA82B